jgi:quercetin dioxygenase-like cupin family protein
MQPKTEVEFKVHSYVLYMQERYNAYRRFLTSEELPIYSGDFIQDARTLELAEWKRRGCLGAYITFPDQMISDMYVAELPPGLSSRPQRQMFEEIVLGVSGHGATALWWSDDGPRHTFEWQRGSLFSIPLNCNYEHINVSGAEPARLLSLTNQPVIWELFRDPQFVFGSRHEFRERFDADDTEFFSKPGKYLTHYYGGILDTSFIADLRKVELVPREKRGKGTMNMYIHLAGSTQFAHISQFPVGTYKKAHRHGVGAHVYTLDSTGYTLMWREGEEPQRYDWSEGSIISPPAGYWHQHYNTGKEPAKFVALHASVAMGGEQEGSTANVEQLDYADEDRKLRDMYVAECERNGVEVKMDAPVSPPQTR